MTKVAITQSKLDDLALHISAKSGEAMPMTIQEMQDAVDGIEVGGTPNLQARTYTVDSAGTETITADSGYDGLSSVEVTVPEGEVYVGQTNQYVTVSGVRKWRTHPYAMIGDGDGSPGYIADNASFGHDIDFNAIPKNTSVTPTESAQTIGGASYMLEGAVTVNAIPSSYVGSGVARKSSSDLTASGDTVTVPAGYYASNATKSVASGTAGTPTATKGAVSNHSVSVTPSVTNTTGYITGGTKTGTAVSVTASELVSGTVNITASGNTDVTNYATASVAAGSATASATKGTVSNHSISVTPSVTRTAGYITAGSANGTAVTVSASELVSGSQTVTTNDTYDVTNLAELVVNVSGGGGSGMQVATATATPSTASTSIQFTGLQGEPTSFYVVSTANLATGASPYKVAAVVYDGSDHHAQIVTNTSNAQATYDGSTMSHTYSNGTLTVTSSSHRFQAVQYKLVYTHGGNSANIGTSDVQVGSGATSISFTGLTEEPTCWSVIFKSNFATSSGYQRVMAVSDDGNATYGVAMDSGASAEAAWTSTYNNGTLTISSQSTSVGGYFHQPGYYQLTYGIGGETEPPTIEPLNVTQNGTYQESGKAYSPVTVNVSGGGSWTVKQETWSNNSTSTVSHQFTGLSGTPKAAVLRCTTQLTRSSSNTYYYIADIIWDGTDAWGNYHLRSNGTFNNVAKDAQSGFNVSTGTNSITFSSDATSRSSAPGSFYNGTYELTYWY